MKLSTPRRGVGRPSLRAWRKDKWRWQSASARLVFPWDFYSKDGGKTIVKLTFYPWENDLEMYTYPHGTVNVYRKLWNNGKMEKRCFSKPLALWISLNLWFHRTFGFWNWHLLGGQWWLWGPQFQGHARRTGHLPTKLENLNLVPGMMAVHGDIHITNKDDIYDNITIPSRCYYCKHPLYYVVWSQTVIIYIYIYLCMYVCVCVCIWICICICLCR